MIVGIDLGTTNSLIALWNGSSPELIPNALGETLTPSAISIADDGSILVGRPALDRLITHPDRSVASFKRWMGSTMGATLAGKVFRAEELSALMLRALRDDAESQFGQNVTEAIVSVPAYFSDPQRRATLDAARLAGLKVERLINEPTAAALTHGLQGTEEGHFLILDLGGGTFDVSLLHKYEGIMEVRASAGDSMLGGNDFRDVLVELIATAAGIKFSDVKAADQARLMATAEAVKHTLSQREQADWDIHLDDKETCKGTLTRASFEERAQGLNARLRAPIERAIADARLDPAQIDQIVLVGGATRMPLVRTMTAKLFGRFPLIDPRPDHVVALGAAIQAGLKARHAALDDIVMTDVCPFTLGVATVDLSMRDDLLLSPIIERNAVIPISRTNRYFTVQDNQSKLQFKVLQGEHLRASQNIQIGEILVDIPRAPAGHESAEARFTYDVNGALEVEVTVTSTKMVERRVFRNQSNLTDDEINARFRTLAALKLAPRDQASNHALIARAERLYAESLGERRTLIAELVGQFEREINDQHLRNAEDLRARFAALLDDFERNVF
ncbi:MULTISPECIES: Hsp70 family protein [unclassified Beijerinckia]|uniref:Hsp70 family protein n=1 Tax=unclassified Beijerinckia TaxID=2638183 RepID=UPI00089B7858|nr:MULTISPECIES: Hsp70 family protein [unclassified Beijerinckia]MDH7795057.1 molecular chaperone HscC [Beijerinckia sp. GAS462]SEB85831.1 molecular chaperone HscC [Beijerinckia sp. 28-YEA-48]